MSRTAIFPGSFDPFTIGHDNIVRRALPLFDKIIIGIGVNAQKKSLFTVSQRTEFIKRIYKNEPRIDVLPYDTLTTKFAREVNATFIIRGIRSVRDFEYERDIAEMNKQSTGIETLLLFTDQHYSHISSSFIRELHSYGEDISKFLPQPL